MICLLYHNVLCLATASRVDQIYTIQACINLAGIKIEETDNGRGKRISLKTLVRVTMLTGYCYRSPVSYSPLFLEARL